MHLDPKGLEAARQVRGPSAEGDYAVEMITAYLTTLRSQLSGITEETSSWKVDTEVQLAALVRSRIGQTYDGEAHFADKEAEEVAAAIEALSADLALVQTQLAAAESLNARQAAVLKVLGIEQCIACDIAFVPGDLVLPDASGGSIHAACCGPERESYVNADGDPLGPDEPIPASSPWKAPAAPFKEALEYAAMGLGRIHDSLLSNGPKQASGEMTAHFRDRARAALATESSNA